MSAFPVLYSFRRCPYAMRARLAVSVSAQRCELREVVLRAKPPEMLAASPKGTVPVLVTNEGQVIEQSLDIMLWALKQHDPMGWLAPETGTLEDCLALIAYCDGDFKMHLDRYKYPERYDNTDAIFHREAASIFLQKLNVRLQTSAYLAGNQPTLADYAIAPFVRQFSHTDVVWFDSQSWIRLVAWLAEFEASALFESVMQKYPTWQSGAEGVIFPD